MKTQTCRLCQAQFVPQETEGYCKSCYFPSLNSQDSSRAKLKMANEGCGIVINTHPGTPKLTKLEKSGGKSKNGNIK